jgi:2-polyprenyl-3-methyl-5-hydroxy-6-metoxy-1,4-benzoquinol methylase
LTISHLVGRVRRAIGRRIPHRAPPPAPLHGYSDHRHEIRYVDPLSDEDLTRLNDLLPWKAFTVDRHGRRFGGSAWKGKRDDPQPVPDRRTLLLNERFRLADKHVLEFGCFEGIHTVGLLQYAAEVTAVDARIENVAKTMVRTALYGYHSRVFVHDVDRAAANYDDLRADVLHHVGVLYHLKDPVRHLLELGRYIRMGLMLDTHYATEEAARQTYEVNGREYRYQLFQEQGRADVFSGLGDSSKWLALDTITGLLQESGFPHVEVVEKRDERNGPRVLLFAGTESR